MILLEYRFREDEELVYDVQIDSFKKIIESLDPDLEDEEEHDIYELKIRHKLHGVNSDGNYLLRMTTQPLRLIRDEEEEKIFTIEQNIDVLMTSFGEILWSSVPSPAVQPPYPNKTLKIGETWQQQGKFMTPYYSHPLILNFVYELQGIEELAGFKCAKLYIYSEEHTFTFSDNITQKMKLDGTNYFDIENGCLARSDISLTIELQDQNETIMNEVKTKIELHRTCAVSLMA